MDLASKRVAMQLSVARSAQTRAHEVSRFSFLIHGTLRFPDSHITRVRLYENRYPHANMPRVAGTSGPAPSTIRNCRNMLSEIATKLDTTVDGLDEIKCHSLDFLKGVKGIVEQREITNLDDFAPVLDELRVFREKRKAGGAAKRSSRGDHWQPWEAKQVLAHHTSSQGNEAGDGEADLLPPSPLGGSSVDSDGFEPPPPDTRVIFCGTSSFENIASRTDDAMFARLSVWPSDKTQAGKGIGLLTAADFKELERELGLGFCSCHGQHEVERRAKVMEERAREREERANEQQSEKIETNSLLTYLSDIKESRVIIFTVLDNHQWGARDLHTFYDKVNLRRAGSLPTPARPRRLAFDEVAADPDTPWKYSYRPITCMGYGDCALADYNGKVVHKQTFLTAEHQVHVQDPSDPDSCNAEQLSLLTCTPPGDARRDPGGQRNGWSTTVRLPPTIRRHRQVLGEMPVALTKFSPGTQDTQTYELVPDITFDFLNRNQGPCSEEQTKRDKQRRANKMEELRRFGMYMYRRLPQVNPQLFASLKVGVRFDICISEKSREGRFFILEARRWPVAESFGDSVLGYPYDAFCKAFGTRFSEQYGTPIAAAPVSEESESGEEESSISGDGSEEEGE
ncbi:hypothetical protein CDV36_011399 [Fusarium kuroshium]|uniref:Uncharacterized protein n=1 Tax=Fusarium kuroshium TaxID=2010991 RepID=A0A3M2RUM8_9HYPO|nr:hypothetical protein CDV36_011399 [Fusarium kuroshium]